MGTRSGGPWGLGSVLPLSALPVSTDFRAADPQDVRWVSRVLVRVTALVMVVTWWLVLSSPTLLTGHYPAGYEWTGLVLLALWYAVLVVAAVRGSADLRVLWPLPVLVVALLVGLLLVPTGPPQLEGQVWVVAPATIAVNLALVIFRWRVALPLIGVIAVALVLVHAEWMGPARATAEIAAIMVGPYIVFVISGHLLTRLLQLRSASADRATAAVRARESGLLAEQKAYWDRLIHDHVLGALILGQRATTPAAVGHAREAARAALASIETRAEPAVDDDWVLQLELFARSRGLVPDTVVSGPPPPPGVAAALSAAARQAVENVARHSGVTSVRIAVPQSADSVTLTIADDGRGFDVGAVEASRMGVQGSIPGHMAAVDGTARVTSAPGRGTTVTLDWGRPERTRRLPVLASPVWLPQALIIVVWTAIHLTLGVLYLDDVARPWRSSAGLAIFLVCLVVLLAWGFRRFVPAVCVALLVAAVLLATGAQPAEAADGRLWFCGALLPIVVVLILIGRVGWGLVLGLGSALLITLSWGLLDGGTAARAAAVAALQLVTFPLICLLLVTALGRTADRIAQADAETARERISAGEAAARIAEGDRRRAALDRDAIPLLRRLSRATTLSPADREVLRVAEGSTRDLLVAAPLVDDDVRVAAEQARRRGARVSLSAEEADLAPSAADSAAASVPPVDVPVLSSSEATMRRVVANVLPHCGPGSELVVRWHPDGSAELGTVVLDAPTEAVTESELADLLQGLPHDLTVTPDEVYLSLQRPT